MGKRVSPAVIGGFVVAALAVLITAIMVVGSGKFFKRSQLYVCMFKGDLSGLKIGAAVKFKGVQIGQVADIRLALTPDEGVPRPGVEGIRLPVIIEIQRSQIVARGGTGAALAGLAVEDAIQRGLRAQLNVESLLTGLLYIDLDLHPNTPLDLVLQPGGRYQEIPTIPTTLESVQKQALDALARFEAIDFKGLATSISSAADAVRSVASSPNLIATLAELRNATANLDRTIVAMRDTLDKLNQHVDPLAASVYKTAAQVNATLEQTRTALAALQSTVDPDSPLIVHLNETLEQLTETSRSIGSLSNYLQRNPSALIRGKYVPDNAQAGQ